MRNREHEDLELELLRLNEKFRQASTGKYAEQCAAVYELLRQARKQFYETVVMPSFRDGDSK